MSEKLGNCKECGGSGCVDGRGGALIKCRCCAGTGVHAPDCAFPRVEACIQGAMRQFPGATGRYYEEVHQRLAPLARDLERELIAARGRIRELEGASQPGGGEVKQKPVAWMHTMDNTEGIKGNKPWTVITTSKRNPFGKPGIDYSASYPVTSEPLYRAAPSAGNGGAEGS